MPLRARGRAPARVVTRTEMQEREEEAARASGGHWRRTALEEQWLLIVALPRLRTPWQRNRVVSQKALVEQTLKLWP
ncbi:hypothetical protein NDU88_004699 [Pleurodeles waltl]|uniref:Uncharacterized protein n=1 Tax=Pleurodeles waltl TaxID=8319 RepID=A0AAV7QCS2_PLEWA|nr:hypothetical protein NDU88_004699 [Pleurodeles waltl]